MSDTTPRRTAGTILSVHRTSLGLVRYRWWPGWIGVELLLLDEPSEILAMVPRTGRTPPSARDSLAPSDP
jgi:hypothetical protein